MPIINVTNLAGEKSELSANSGDTLMEALRDNGYDEIQAICGGVCSCSTCHVYIEEGWMDKVGKRSEDENQLVSSVQGFKGNSRLACQIMLKDDLDGLQISIAKQSY